MLRISLVFGSIAGLIVIAVLILGIVFPNTLNHFNTEWFGYLVMIVALSLIFVGVKRYRDNDLGGVIRFLPALGLGLGIAVVAAVIYVAMWEVYLASTGYQFMNHYVDGMIAAKKAHGLSGPALYAFVAQMNQMKADYDNPLYRLPMTFVEIFPVGLIIAVISAAVLRNPRMLPARA
jgi:hypothetical protein